jgi:rhodanese-related sulfurtransferase
MKNKAHLFILITLLSALSSQITLARCTPNKDLPLREVFLSVDCIDTKAFTKKIDNNNVLIIDARTKTEFDILKIKGAINLDIDDKEFFIKEIAAVRGSNPSDIVFYCNGKRCNLSYRASALAVKLGIKNTYVYDRGIFKFSTLEPKKVLLFNQKISADNKVISSEKYKKHLTTLENFQQMIANDIKTGEAFRILDIRDKSSHNGSSAFVGVMHERYIPLSNIAKLKKYLRRVAQQNASLYVYDWGGAKLKWVQYYIEQQGIDDYYLLQGGAFHKINEDLKEQGLPLLSL